MRITKEAIVKHIVYNVNTNNPILLELGTNSNTSSNNQDAVPDNYIWRVKPANTRRRIALGKEKFVFYLSRIGFDALKDDIKKGLVKLYSRHMKDPEAAWKSFHYDAREELGKIITNTINHASDLSSKIKEMADILELMGLGNKKSTNTMQMHLGNNILIHINQYMTEQQLRSDILQDDADLPLIQALEKEFNHTFSFTIATNIRPFIDELIQNGYTYQEIANMYNETRQNQYAIRIYAIGRANNLFVMGKGLL